MGRAKLRYQVLNIVVIDDFDLHSFQFKIDIVIFGRFLRFSSAGKASSRFCIPVAGQCLNKEVSI